MAETVAFSSPADEKLALELVAKRTQALQARIAELEQALRGIEDLCQRGAGEDADMDAQEALMQIWEAARKAMEPSKERGKGWVALMGKAWLDNKRKGK